MYHSESSFGSTVTFMVVVVVVESYLELGCLISVEG